MKTNDYTVYLWPGQGYLLNDFKVTDCSSECEALDKVVVHIIENDWTAYFLTEAQYEEMFAEELEEDEQYQNEQYLYVDATMEGAPYPIYLMAENLKIIEG